jgi:hypothetical protein
MKKLWILVLLLVLSKSAAATPPSLPFIHDDYGKALTEARQQKLPIFVECWAPW